MYCKPSVPERVARLRRRGETADVLRGGAVYVLQKEKGYRFSIDALLLADFTQLKKGSRIAELGSGSGVIAIVTASRYSTVEAVGIDVQKSMVLMARRSVQANQMKRRVTMLHGDVRSLRGVMPAASFDAVVCNPPYRKIGSGRINTQEERALARHEIAGTVEHFCRAAGYLLRDGGHFFVIFPALRAVRLITGMKQAGIEPKRLRLVHSSARSRAEFVMADGVKGGGEGAAVMPPLYLYRKKGVYTAEAETILSQLTACRDVSD